MSRCINNNRHQEYNRILQALGVTFWKLRYPVVLDYNNSIELYPCLRLLLISSDLPVSLDDPFVKDVIHAMRINLKAVCVLTINQIKTLIIPVKFSCYCWWVDTEVFRDFHGISIKTPALPILKCNIQAKCDLWRQIESTMLT